MTETPTPLAAPAGVAFTSFELLNSEMCLAVDGTHYALRFLIRAIAEDGTTTRTWGPWVKVPNALAERLHNWLQDYMGTRGHLSTSDTGQRAGGVAMLH